MTWSGAHKFHLHGREFEPFLYASVGEDRNGYLVTVLSTLVRLGLDPWKEAADLAALSREAAGERLGQLLSKFRDVPALGQEHGSVALALTRLLPARPALGAKLDGTVIKGSWISPATIWALLAVFLILAQIIFAGTPQPGA